MTKKNIFLFISIALGVTFLISIFFMRPFFEEPKKKSNDLIITALGQKQALSAGTDIRIEKITLNDQELNLNSLTFPPPWHMDEKLLAIYGATEPTTINIPLGDATKAEITFIKQVGSGMVTVFNDKFDLYSNNPEWEKQVYKWNASTSIFSIKNWIRFMALWAMITVFITVIFNIKVNRKLIPFFSNRVLIHKQNSLRLNKIPLNINNTIIIGLISILMTFLLINTGLKGIFTDRLPQDVTVSITPLGEKNEESWGYQIRLLNIYVNNTETVDIMQYVGDGKWINEGNNVLMWDGRPTDGGDTLNIPISNAKQIDVIYATQNGSGYVDTQINDANKERKDLYSGEKEWRKQNYHYLARGEFNLWGHIDWFILIYLIIFIGLHLLFILVHENIYSNQDILLLSKIFYVIYFIAFGWIYINIFLNYIRTDWSIIFIASIVLLVWTLLYLILRARNLSSKGTWIIFGAVLLVMFILQYNVAYQMNVTPGWDYSHVFHAVDNAINHDGMTKADKEYFTVYPNNTFLLLLLYSAMRIFSLFTNNLLYSMILFNILMIDLAITVGFIFCKKYWGNSEAILFSIICLLFIPYYNFTPYFYTDTMSILFLLSSLLLLKFILNTKLEKQQIINSFLLGVLLLISYKCKGNIIVLMVSTSLFLLLKQTQMNRKKILLSIISGFLVSALTFNLFTQQLPIYNHEIEEYVKTPYTHWIMMGLYEQGGYSQKLVDITSSIDSQVKKKKRTMEKIQLRLNDLTTVGLGKHLTNKAVNNTWGDGLYHVYEGNDGQMNTDNIVQQVMTTNGKYYATLTKYANGYHMALLTLLILSIMIGFFKKNIDLMFILRLSMFGLFVFLLIWETRARYVLNFTPLLFILGLEVMQVFNERRELKRSVKH